MKSLLYLVCAFIFTFISCTGNEKTSVHEPENSVLKVETNSSSVNSVLKESKDTLIESSLKDSITNPESFLKFIADDYPITYKMMKDHEINSSKVSGKTVSHDKIWFKNDNLKQTLIFDLYTDGFRVSIFHFLNNNIPLDIIEKIELNTKDGQIASNQQKKEDFQGFLNQAVSINTKYFTSKKGIKLGDEKSKLLKIYGKPNSKTVINGIEKLEWNFIGDQLNEETEESNEKTIAENSFGHQASLFFKDNHLIGLILHNDIP
jgi:hypothetical protein